VAGIAVVLSLLPASCERPRSEATGAAQLSVEALHVNDIAEVAVTIAAPSLSVPLTLPLVRSGNRFSGLAGQLPAGSDYSFTAVAVDASAPPVEIFRGVVAGQVIEKNRVANIVINMNQTATAAPLSDRGPLIDAVSVSSFRVGHGDPVRLKAIAHDPDPGETAVLTFVWSASCGLVEGSVVTAGDDATPAVVDAVFLAPSVDAECSLNLVVTDPRGIGNHAATVIRVAAAHGTGSARIVAHLDTYPLITALSADPAQLEPGLTTNLAVIASDPDGDALTYAWSTSCPGSFSTPNAATTSFVLAPSASASSCDFQVVVTDGTFPDGQPKGGVLINHLVLAVQPIVVTVPPRILYDYQNRAGFAPGIAVGMAIAADDPSGGLLSYSWTSSFGPAPTVVEPAALGLQPGVWSSAAVFSSDTLPLDGSFVVVAVTVTSSATGQSVVNRFELIPGPVIVALGSDRTHLSLDSPTLQLSASVVGAQGNVLLYAWSSDCQGGFSDPSHAFTTFTLAETPASGACVFTLVATDVNYPDGPGSGGQVSEQLTVPVLACGDAEVNVCGGCGILEHAPGASCGACGTYACSDDGSAVSCVDPGHNACGGCGDLAFPPGDPCGVCGTQACSADRTSVLCSDPGRNACGGCGLLAHLPGSACGACGGYQCSADLTEVACVDPGPNACGGCGPLAAVPGAGCGACGIYECTAERTAVTCHDPGLNACGGCGVLGHAPGTSCGVRGSYACSLDKTTVVCVDCDIGWHDGGDRACRVIGTCSPGFHGDGTGTCVAEGCAAGFVMSGGECLPTFVSVGADTNHGCGLKATGEISCWGQNGSGEAMAPAGTFVAMGAGQYHGCAVKTDGTLQCWGLNTSGQATPPAGTFTMVGGGYSHSCGIRSDTAVLCWGANGYGQSTAPAGGFAQLSVGGNHACGIRSDSVSVCWGLGTSGQTNVPAGVAFLAVAAGGNFTCGIKADHTLACWGSSTYGQTSPPAGSFASVSAGAYHACGVRTDGSIACWGQSSYGQTTAPPGPFRAVSAGGSNTCGIRGDGTVACWGADGSGQSHPRQSSYRSVGSGSTHGCAVKFDGSLECWGSNGSGESTPPVGDFTDVSSGASHSCARRSDGTLACWGLATAIAAMPAGTFATLAAGANHNCAIRGDGVMACWGANASGQSAPPGGMTFGTAAGSVAGGTAHTCGVQSNGSVACWGANASGQALAPGGTFQKVVAGAAHSCAIATDGTLACWGLNNKGQASPPSGTFVSLTAGDSSTCGVKTSGTVTCWGAYSSTAPATPPAGLIDLVSTSANGTCGLNAGGLLRCWGYYWSSP
jgi:alpha-tubulin suppressor-like RCC1 family protein